MIYKRGKSWRVIVYVGRDPMTGKQLRKGGSAPTRAEAKLLEARLVTEAAAANTEATASGPWPSCWTAGSNGARAAGRADRVRWGRPGLPTGPTQALWGGEAS